MSASFSICSDCGLSVSWEPAKDKGGHEGFSPGSIKDKDVLHTWVSTTQVDQKNNWSSVLILLSAHAVRNMIHIMRNNLCCICSVDTHGLNVSNFMLYQQKRKNHNTESKCNETSKLKRQRLSVLRLSRETEREGPSSPTYIYLQERAQARRVGRSAPTGVSLEENVEECLGLTSILLDGGEDGREEEPTSLHESPEDVHLHNLDRSIVQFTVGANDPKEVLLPIIGSNLEPVEILGSPAKANPSEPSE